jgi:hypothetical protein
MIEKGQLQVDGTFQVQIGLKLPYGGGGYQTVPDLVHEKSDITSAINQPTRHIHQFSTVNLDVVDLLTKNSVLQNTPEVNVRIGVTQGQGIFWFQWQHHILLFTDIVPLGKGYSVSFVTADFLEAAKRQYVTKYYTGTISSMVETIAHLNGLNHVVEPTEGNWSFIQSAQTDADFLAKLAFRSVNKFGRGGFRFFVLDNVLHFHSLDYAATIRNANVFSLSGTKVVLSSRVQDAVDEGAPGVNVLGIDPYEGATYSIKSDPTKVVNHGNQAPDLTQLNPTLMAFHPSANRVEELKAIAQSKYDFARADLMNCTLTVEKGYPIQINDLIRVTLNSASAQQSPWGGLYTVVAVSHVITKGTSTSTIKLQRGEFLVSNLAKSNADGAINTSDYVAKGQPIDLNDISTSLTTKGPPDSFTDGRYVRTIIPTS